MFGDVLHDMRIQALEQFHPFRETLLEVYFASHCPLGNLPYLVSDPGTLGQFVDTFRLNQRRVHVEADETAHSAVHVIPLERKVYAHVGRHFHQLFLHPAVAFRRSPQ